MSTIEKATAMLPTHPQRKQPNSKQLRVQIEGETIDLVMAQFMFETIRYAMSFADGTWSPNRRTLFQIANQFPQN